MMGNERRTTLAAFLLLLLFAGMADSIMDALGPGGFLCVGAAIMSASAALVGKGEDQHDYS